MLNPEFGPTLRRALSKRGLAAACIFTTAAAVGFGTTLHANETSPAHLSLQSETKRIDRLASVDSAPPRTRIPGYTSYEIDDLPLHAMPEEGSGYVSQHLQVVTRGTLARGQTLGQSLHSHGIPAHVADTISREMRGHFDFHRAQPGHRYRLAQDSDGRVLDFRYHDRATESLHLWLGDFGYTVKRESAELFRRTALLSATIETSLYKAMRDAGETAQLANDFADIFAWDLDFNRVVRSGDDFQVLYERLYHVDDDGNEVYVRPGQILAAHYNGLAGSFSAVYFDEDGVGSFFRPDGTAVKRHFLVSPLKFGRISSSYTSSRRHPILNVTRPHHGIDYAAPEGTPVHSIADGTVIHRGWAGGFGNLVKIRHSNGFVSYYAHLSRYPADLKVGQRVAQQDVIGYVGHTGLATGNHICFRIAKDGQYVNPMKLKGPERKPIAAENWTQFSQVRDQLLARLQMNTAFTVNEAL